MKIRMFQNPSCRVIVQDPVTCQFSSVLCPPFGSITEFEHEEAEAILTYFGLNWSDVIVEEVNEND